MDIQTIGATNTEKWLELYPYKMTVLPELTVPNKYQRMAFAEWSQNNVVSFNNVWFSNTAHFHLDGVVNKQNAWFWALENPCVIHEKVHRALRITVLVSISSRGLLQPIFIEKTMKNECYLSMLHNTFVPHLFATGLSLQTQWFMQDGAWPHTANVVWTF
jgi:hypothetical protein